MRWAWLSLLLLLPLPATAGVMTICTTGDTQEGVRCDNHADAWTHQEAAIDWVADNPTVCDVVIFPGDLITGFEWQNDCWCMGQTDDGDCSDLTNPYTEVACGVDECGNAEAAACVGGVGAGDSLMHYCENDRVRHMLDTLTAAGVPWITVPGNHDTNTKASLQQKCIREFDEYNRYFGKGKMSAGFDEVGVFEHTVSCSALSGNAERADQSYHVLSAAGVKWLFLAMAWDPVDGLNSESVAYFKEVIEDHPGMPTIPIHHHTVNNTCANADDNAPYDSAWCGGVQGDFSTVWAGTVIFDELLYPQTFFTFGAHINELAMATTTTTDHKVLGTAVDYTNNIPDAPEWQTNDNNGGGGLIQMFRIQVGGLGDGLISSKAYSPEEDDWLAVYGAEGSHWSVNIPLCTADNRFDLPAAACPEFVPTKSINLGNIRQR